MTARELYQAGKLDEAVQALNGEVRDNPTDPKRRTFLFELLCFAGNFDRAEKQLQILAQENKDAQMGALIYHAALHAERTRHELFQKKEYPRPAGDDPQSPPGIWNGKPFASMMDADARIGPRLEVYAAGQYLWIPFEHITSVEMQAPKRLRDMLWAPALVHTSAAFKGRELGEILVPALTPFSWQHANDAVKLGRMTDWQDLEDGQTVPVGQKMFLIDNEEVPLLELRHLEFQPAPVSADQHAAAR